VKVSFWYFISAINILADYLQIITYKSLYIRYQSQEDFRECEDILRCSPSFHGRPRYDSVMINTDSHDFGRLELLFRCEMPSGKKHDLMLITPFKSSKWKPRTLWDNCKIYDPAAPRILSLRYATRGALLVDTDLIALSGQHFFVDDLIDQDMFIRMGN
jgi:hypothetical protein